VRIRKWYWIVLVVWLITGFPILIIGIGFAGPDLFTFEGLLTIFTPDFQSFRAFFSWLSSFLIVFLPALLLPLALEKTSDSK
jgi:uncharacterized membrane protein YhaH (DUF805 family)